MIILDCAFEWKISDWNAVAAIAAAAGSIVTLVMAIATFVTIRRNKKQFDELKKQNFESGFMNRIAALNEVRNCVYFKEGDKITRGPEAFEKACQAYYNGNNFIRTDDGKEVPDIKANYNDVIHSFIGIQSYYDSLSYVFSYVGGSYEYRIRIIINLPDVENKWLNIYCKKIWTNKEWSDLQMQLQEADLAYKNRH